MGEFREHELVITTRDKVMRAWQNSTELVRDFQSYAHDIQDDDDAVQVFLDFAAEEAEHASRFLAMLHQYQKNGIN
ncbi:MAG: rubrerythrin [Clostridia bacterium]|nr:rubrerythrin [Clostridia bacterium]